MPGLHGRWIRWFVVVVVFCRILLRVSRLMHLAVYGTTPPSWLGKLGTGLKGQDGK